jgi:crotonobetainyl-CoA:carnitine CoA-transferase CaiB-like acyl-CoA transferase
MALPRGPLWNVRVLDLTDTAGAYCGKLLADLGADVVKVEPPSGAAMRRIGPFHTGIDHTDRSLFFWHYNTSKRSVVLDLHAAHGRECLARLAEQADLILETGPPGALDERGLGYPVLVGRNPRLSMVSITSFGQSGPQRNWSACDLVAQAAGGMVYVNGAPESAPLQGVGLQAYHSASIYGAIGALLALLAREQTGRGQWVDVSIQESVAACVEHASSLYHHDGRIAERQGGLHWTGNFRVGQCADSHVLHCTLCDWTTLLEWLRADGCADDLTQSSWEDFNFRRDHCQHLFDVLDRWAARYTVREFVDGAQLRRLPYAPVASPATLAENPQLRDRGFFVPVHHDELGTTLTYPGAPYIFSRTPWQLQRRPPRLGEHTAEVLAEWGARREQQTALHTTDSCAPPASPPAREDLQRGTKPLHGVRVLDFTWVVAGPLATRILADHGAEVIKVERRDAPDFGSRRGGLTGNLNRGKRSLVIDMAVPAGIALAKRLVAASDVLVENFSARVLGNWGMDDDALGRLNPRLITLHMSGFGHTGPDRDLVSYGPVLQALAGHTSLMRDARGAPMGWGFSYADMAAGISGAFAVLAALWARRRSGEGQSIDLSQFENLTALLGPGLLELLLHGQGLAAIDNRSQEVRSAPHGVYRCADRTGDGPARDRWCAMAVFGDDQWRRFCRVLDDPPWVRDPRFADAGNRLMHQVALDRHIEAWTRPHAAEAVVAALQQAGISASVVANAEDLCRHDPQLQARGYWVRVPTPEGDYVDLDGIPVRLSDTPGSVASPGPLLGEHTDAVLREVLQLTAGDIGALRAAHVIA